MSFNLALQLCISARHLNASQGSKGQARHCSSQTQGDAAGTEPFLLDAVEWVRQCEAQNQLQPVEAPQWQLQQSEQELPQQQQQQQQQCSPTGPGDLWHQGCMLVRQAVLWGLPLLSTELVNTLMALPCAPVDPFAHLLRAHTGSSSGSGSSGDLDKPTQPRPATPCRWRTARQGGGTYEDGTTHLGGLLHLALLSPRSCDMLQQVLGWGDSYRRGPAAEGGPEGYGFAWEWEECNQAGQTPLSLLLGLPEGAALLRQLGVPTPGGIMHQRRTARAAEGELKGYASSGSADGGATCKKGKDGCQGGKVWGGARPGVWSMDVSHQAKEWHALPLAVLLFRPPCSLTLASMAPLWPPASTQPQPRRACLQFQA